MPYSEIRRIKEVVSVVEWEIEGDFHIDQDYPVFINYVIAEDDNGEKWVHERNFPNDSKAAKRLADRVQNAGFISLKHWGFHEYFSLSFEERMNHEAELEALEEERMNHEAELEALEYEREGWEDRW